MQKIPTSPTSQLVTPNLHHGSTERGFGGLRSAVDRTGQFGEGDKGEAENARLAVKVHDILRKYYPGQPWFVAANVRQGIVCVQLPCFTQYSYVLHTANLQTAKAMDDKVREAGGAFLECYNIPRAGFDMDHFMRVLRDNPLGPLNKTNPDAYTKTPEMSAVEKALTKMKSDIKSGDLQIGAA